MKLFQRVNALRVRRSRPLPSPVAPGFPGTVGDLHRAASQFDLLPLALKPGDFFTMEAWQSYQAQRAFAGARSPVTCQVRMRGGLVECATVRRVDLHDEKTWVQVIMAYDNSLRSYPGPAVRLCSGDGRCTCEAGRGEALEALGAACLPPLGNTGVTP